MDSQDTTKSIPINGGTREDFYEIPRGLTDLVSHLNRLTRWVHELETRLEKLETNNKE